MDHDQALGSTLLLCEKNCCDLLQHAVIESSTQNVRNVFTNALNDALSMSDALYQEMASKGWYKTDCAPQQKVSELKQKFAPTC